MKILFLCTGNSVRSQMAEGFARHFAKQLRKDIVVFSAGSQPASLIHPLAVKVMEEVGIDISNQQPKGIEDIPLKDIDLIVTLCGDARETCPVIEGVRREHWDLPDPARSDSIAIFREVRDEIGERVRRLLRSLSPNLSIRVKG